MSNGNTKSLEILVANVTEKSAGCKDATKPYVGLEHIPSGGGSLIGCGSAADSISTNNVFRAGDTLFGKLRPQLHKSVRVPFDGYCSTDILVLRPLTGVCGEFAAKVVQSDTVFAQAIRTEEGTKMPRTSWQAIRCVEVFAPHEVVEQRKIARILTTLDNLIEKTESLIAKYQAIKQGMMHDLFTRGIDAHDTLRPTQAEAPDLYQQSELGWIPKEWTSRSVGQVLIHRPRNGYSPKESDEWTGTLMLGLGCLTPSGFEPIQLKHVPKNDPNLASALLKDGDLLISRSNTRDLVALVGIYRAIGTPCIYSDLMMRLVPTDEVLPEYLEAVLGHVPVRRQLTNASCGTSGSMMKINAEMVVSTVIALPKKDEQQRILDRVASISRFIMQSRKEREKLRLQKTGLMQDLLTGKVRVKADEAEEVPANG